MKNNLYQKQLLKTDLNTLTIFEFFFQWLNVYDVCWPPNSSFIKKNSVTGSFLFSGMFQTNDSVELLWKVVQVLKISAIYL